MLERRQRSARLLQCHSRFQPADNAQNTRAAHDALVGNPGDLERLRRPDFRRRSDPRKRQVRQNADDRVRRAVERDAAADHIRIAAEAFLPEGLRHHRHIGGFFFFRQKVAPPDRSDPEHIEVVRRHLPAEDLHRIAEPGERECGDVFRAEAVEDRLALAIMLKARHGDCELEQVALARVRIHVHEPLRLLERESAQEQIVDQTEDGGVQSDAECKRQDGNQSEPRRFAKLAKSEF